MKTLGVIAVTLCIVVFVTSNGIPSPTFQSNENIDYSKQRKIYNDHGRALTSIGGYDGFEFWVDETMQSVTFGEALDFCHSFTNLTMAAMYTLNQMDWAGFYMPRDYDPWLGGSDLMHEGTWQWMKTNDEFVFIRWGPNQPTLSRAYNCMYLRHSLRDWVSVSCGFARHRVMCESPMPENNN